MAYVTYTIAAGTWRLSGFVTIISVLSTSIAVFPMDFLRTCGDNTWGYIFFAVSWVIDVDPLHSGDPGDILGELNHPVDRAAAPVQGTFCFVEEGKTPLYAAYLRASSFQAKKAM